MSVFGLRDSPPQPSDVFYRLQAQVADAATGRCSTASGECGLLQISHNRNIRFAISHNRLWEIQNYLVREGLSDGSLGKYIGALCAGYDWLKNETVANGTGIEIASDTSDQTQQILDDQDAVADQNRPAFIAVCLFSILLGGNGEVYLFDKRDDGNYLSFLQGPAPISQSLPTALVLITLGLVAGLTQTSNSGRGPGRRLIVQPAKPGKTGEPQEGFAFHYDPTNDDDLNGLAEAVRNFLAQNFLTPQNRPGRRMVQVPNLQRKISATGDADSSPLPRRATAHEMRESVEKLDAEKLCQLYWDLIALLVNQSERQTCRESLAPYFSNDMQGILDDLSYSNRQSELVRLVVDRLRVLNGDRNPAIDCQGQTPQGKAGRLLLQQMTPRQLYQHAMQILRSAHYDEWRPNEVVNAVLTLLAQRLPEVLRWRHTMQDFFNESFRELLRVWRQASAALQARDQRGVNVHPAIYHFGDQLISFMNQNGIQLPAKP